MKALALWSVAAGTCLFFQNVALAQTWSPSGPVALSSNGAIFINTGLASQCTMSGILTLSGPSATITSLSASGGGFCAAHFLENTTNIVEATSLSTLTIKNVRLIGWATTCQGDLAATFNQATGQITFMNAMIPPVAPNTVPCYINGRLNTTPTASYTIP